MSLTAQIYAAVRQGARAVFNSGGTQTPQINQGGDLLMAQCLPERAEIVRLGKSWSAQVKEANAFTALITIPSTLAEFALQNVEAVGGASYLIDRVWCKCVTTTAAANYLTLLAQVTPPGTVPIATSANAVVNSLSGKAGYTGKAQIGVHSVVTGALADKWAALGGPCSLPTSTSIAALVEAYVYGRYVIPPGGVFNVNAQEAVSGGTCIIGVEWHEMVIDLG